MKEKNLDTKEKYNKKNQKNSKFKNMLKKDININVDVNFSIIAVILIIIFCICITPIKFQNDTYYTIKIGEYIRNYGIDMMDHFSWHEGLNYTYPHWLYDFCTYMVYSVAGFNGIYFMTCLLSVILGLSIFFVNDKLNKTKAISFAVTIGAMYMLKDYVTARAQLVTFILFIWEIFCIEKILQNKKIFYGLILIIISLLIANLHVATWPFFFILFLPYIAEYFISIISDAIIYRKIRLLILKIKIKIFDKKGRDTKVLHKFLKKVESEVSKIKIKREKEKSNPYKITINKNKNIKFLIIIMIICILMGLFTPIGDTPYTYLYKTMKGNTTQSISEHLPLTLIKSTNTMCALVIFLAILIFTKVKIRLSDLFMITGLCYLMLSTRRQISMFTLIGSVILTRLIVDLINRYTKNGMRIAEESVKNILVILSISVFIGVIGYGFIKPKFGDEFVDSGSYPVKACDYILENMDLEDVRFYNEYNYGSYMLFRGIPVFIDSRADLYAPEFSGNPEKDIFSDFIETSGMNKFYEEIFNKYDITHVILSKKSKTYFVINNTKDPNYKELYSDDNFIIYERINIDK